MVRLNDHMKLSASLQLVGRYIISFIFVVFTQFAISLVPRFFPSSPFFIQLTLLAVSSLIDALFNGQIAVIVIGFCRILLSDPGRVTQESLCSDRLVESSDFGVEPGNKGSPSHRRVRYCKRCKAHIKGFDHHCPAYGNCIGENNYVLFIALLLGFLSAEASYVVCSVQFVRKIQRNDTDWSEINVFGNLAISTMLFSILQILWQGVFLSWHLYCVCFNIRTDEWINWMKYPEFQLVQSEPGTSFTRVEFRNPYDKGVLQNVKELLAIR